MKMFWVVGLAICLLFGAAAIPPALAQSNDDGDDDDDGSNDANNNNGSLLAPLNLDETMSLGDILLQQVGTGTPDQSPPDLGDIIDQVLPGDTSVTRQIDEGISLSDSIEWTAQIAQVSEERDLLDSIGLGDSVSAPKSTSSATRNIADSVAVSDSPARTVVAAPVPNPTPPPNPTPTPTPTPAPTPAPVGQNPPPRANIARFLIESLEVNDSSGNDVSDNADSMTAAVESELRVQDNIAVSGLVVPPSAPIISLTSPPLMELSGDETAQITFHSTTTGTYEITIQNADGEAVRSLEGEMGLGANSAIWDGRDSSDAKAPPGRYVYYIAAEGEGGSRDPPQDGDGVIRVAGSPAIGPVGGPQLDPTFLIIVAVVVAAAGAGLLIFFMRRPRSLVMYLPAAASEVIDDMRQRYPNLVVEDYVDPGDPGLLKGVTIKNPKASDEQWLTDMAEKAKSLAGVDSVNITYRGKQQTL